jgi:hypothetical protein
MRKGIPCKWKPKLSGIVTLDKINFNSRTVKRDKEGPI